MYSIKNIATILSGVIVLATVSCKKVEIKPIGNTPPSEAYKSEADVKDLINSAYTILAATNFYGGRLQKVSEYLADAADGSGVSGYEGDIYNYKTSPNSGTQDIYSEPYIGIARANATLEHLDLVTSNTATRENYEGQAKFVRAISHFELVKLFAQPYGFSADNSHPGIIIKTVSTFETARSRNTVKEVYDAIIKDLNEAQNLLPATNGIYPTRWAAKGYLARVYFQMNKFDSAYKYADQVITSSGATFDNSANFVTNRFSNPVSQESVFYLVNESTTNPRFGTLSNNDDTLKSLNLPITQAAYQLGTSNSNDRRRTWYKDSLNASTNTHTYSITKYKRNNFILNLLHITEMKLVRAESAAALGTNLAIAIQDINDITNRAYGGALTPLAGTATAAQVLSRVRAERRLEMIYENGDRLQQIKRLGALGLVSVSHGNAPWNCPGIVLQFPAQEFNVNINFEPNQTGGCI